MPQDHRLQEQRFELKYLVEEALTSKLRDFISGHLELDDYCARRPDLSYPVHSLYLDSNSLHTHQAAVNGTKNRYKLRLRYYDDKPGSPVFFELKGRVDNCIVKRRCGVRRTVVEQILNGFMPEPDQVVTDEPHDFASLERFMVLMADINARPKAHNFYWREAWVSSNDNSIRVTFDRDIVLEPHFHCTAEVALRQPIPVHSPFVVLELKFTDRFPTWFNDMVQCFNLMQSAAAKYSGGVLLLGEHCFHGHAFSNVVGMPCNGTWAEDLLEAEL